jgi:hypothetical protein
VENYLKKKVKEGRRGVPGNLAFDIAEAVVPVLDKYMNTWLGKKSPYRVWELPVRR